jgi:polyisoprenoid-binding protein YceI
MKYKNSILAILFFTSLNLVAQEINSKESVVKFSISNMKVRTVDGTFSNMTGKIDFDESKPEDASFDVCIDASTINTDNEKRDKHLKTSDFFDVEKYPKICFKSTSISKSKDGYLAKGKLTMHGVTKDVEINFSYKDKKFEGKLDINRFDYKIGVDTKSVTVGETASLTILCVVK